jgi:hypothetical protein
MDKQYGKKKGNIRIELPHLENPSTSVDLVADSMGLVPDYRGAMSRDLQVGRAEKPREQRCLGGGGGGAHTWSDLQRTELC